MPASQLLKSSLRNYPEMDLRLYVICSAASGACIIYLIKERRAIMKNHKYWLTMGVILALSSCHGSVSAQEADISKAQEQVDVYEMDDTIVTATRTAKKDVDVPASTVVITSEEIKASGASNVAEALYKVNGFIAKSMGARGASMGTMTNELGIRGIRNGTLVLMNGSPFAWRGNTNLEQIPVQNIERIEIVKGGGSVLYGSEAMAGVVNIITKKGLNNQISAGFGNFGQQDYHLSAGDDKMNLHYSYNRWAEQNGVKETEVTSADSKIFTGSTRTDLLNVEKRNIGFSYKFNPNLTLIYDYYNNKSEWNRYVDRVDKTTKNIAVGDPFNGREYTTEQHITQLNYQDANWKANFYYNTNSVESHGPTYMDKSSLTPNGYYNTRERNTTLGTDIQRSWKLGEKSEAILGADLQHETYQALPTSYTKTGQNYMRNNWAIFGQWEQKFDDRNTATLGMRETWTSGAGTNYSNFSAAAQWLHKMDEKNNIYVSMNQSFIMPTLTQIYGSGALSMPATDLKPQTGMNYEIGWKQEHNDHSWRAAIFHADIKDNIAAKWRTSGLYQYTNEDFRNTGIELSCDIKGKNGWSYQYGVTWQNPQTKNEKKQNLWEPTQGKLQLTGGITYKKDKFSTSLTGSYLCNRVQSPSDKPAYSCKPYLLTNWTFSYAPDAQSEIALSIENLLNREDVTMHTGSNYYVAPINYMLSYNYRF